VLVVGNDSAAQAPERVGSAHAGALCDEIVLFHREGCPYCERARAVLDYLERENPELAKTPGVRTICLVDAIGHETSASK
jgi:hypothetical protein